MILAEQLTRRYGEHIAVDHLCFHIEKGKICGLLGPNGAGKSTTLNMLTGCLAPTEGTITIDGHSLWDEPLAARRCIGYLPEQPPLYGDMTPKEYLTFVARAKFIEKKRIDEAVRQVMEQTGVTDMANRLISQLSKGYRQRVGIAQALLGDPPCIILDEPTVGLDPRQITEIRELIAGLGKTHTVLISSHILSEISALCDEVMILSHGKLIATDTPAQLEARMGRNTLELTVRGDRAAIAAAVRAVPNVSESAIEAAGERQWTLHITGEGEADLRETLSLALAEKHCAILEMQKKTLSLEEVFLQLTGEDEIVPETEENHSKRKERARK